MGLQNFLMNRLIENSVIGKKIQSGDNVSKKGQFALDATEKNPNIEDTMAEKIANLENETKRLDNSVKKVISLPNGASTGDGQIEDAKVGIEGESYDTLGDAIREQVKTYRDVDVSNTTPTSKAKVWVNTSTNDTESQDILLPQVDDANISEENTWSSKKIDSEIGEVKSDITNLCNYANMTTGYYGDNGSLIGDDDVIGRNFHNIFLECESGDRFYIDNKTLHLTMTLWDVNKQFIQTVYGTGNSVVIPDGVGAKFISIPVSHVKKFSQIISKEPFVLGTVRYILPGTTENVLSMMPTQQDYLNKFKSIVSGTDVVHFPEMTLLNNGIGLTTKSDNDDSQWWAGIDFGTTNMDIGYINGFIKIAESDEYYIVIRTIDVLKMSKHGVDFKVMKLFDTPLEKHCKYHIEIQENSNTLIMRNAITNELVMSLDMLKFVDDSYTYSFGLVYMENNASYSDRMCMTIYDSTEFTGPRKVYRESQWDGKNWFAYGTSVTNIDGEGRYANHLKDISHMKLTNKGISGGGICSNKNIKNAVMNDTDGKLSADLITLEVGANDGSCNWGTIYDDASVDTFCGNLNACIRYLQEKTNAQIVVMSSPIMIETSPNSGVSTPPEYKNPSNNLTKFDKNNLIRQVCELNSVYYIPLGSSGNFGYYKQIYHKELTQDGIHPSDLGGYNLAQFIWSQLKNIPLMYTKIPSN